MNRLTQQMEFIKEIDKLKSVLRRSLVIVEQRYENSAEHSWHFALMSLILAEHYPHSKNIDLFKVLSMALIHDLAEIYAGDTYCYDQQHIKDQHERELAAIQKVLDFLPADQYATYFALWMEFEAGQSHESKFARVMDRLNPFMLNYFSGGTSWVKHQVKRSQVLVRMGEIEQSCPDIWRYVMGLLSSAIEQGWIIDDCV